MAQENITELGFDASPVIAALNQLDAAFNTYTQALRQNIAAIGQFNSVQSSTGSIIDQTAGKMAALRDAARNSAIATRDLLAPSGGSRSKATLSEIGKVNDAVKNLENTLTRTKTGDEGLFNILGNLKGNFTGNLGEVQSAVIRLKSALDGLGKTNLNRTSSILKQDAANLQADIDSRIKLAGKLLDAQNKAKLSAERGAIGQAAATTAGQRFSTIGADPAKIAAFNNALQRLQQTVEKSGVSSKRFLEILNSGNQTFAGQEGRVKAAINNVDRLGRSMTSASQSASSFQFNLQSLAKVFTFQVALHSLSALTQEFGTAISRAVEFEKSIAQVATIADDGSRNIDTLAHTVLELSNEFGKPNAEVAAGLYQAVSNQVGTTTETVQFLTTALEFSRAAITSLSSSVDTLSGVQNAYNQTVAQTQRNSDILFKVIDLGRVTADELGQSFGRITPLAAQLGVSLEEVGAAIAASTVQGVNFRDAQTQILNILVEAIKPTGAFKERMKELGFETAEAGIAAKGFVGFFSAIGEGAKNSEELAKLFNNIRGLRGQLSVFARDGELVTKALNEIEQTAGDTRRAFEQIQFTNAIKIESEINRIRNTLEAGFGRKVLSIVAELSDAFGGLSNVIIALGATAATVVGGAVFVIMANQMLALAAAAGTLLSSIGVIASGATGLGLLLPGGALVVGVVAGIGLITAAIASLALQESPTQQLLNDFKDMEVASAKASQSIIEDTRKEQEERKKATEEATRAAITSEEQRALAVRQATEQAIALEKAQSSSLQQQLNSRLSIFQKFTESIKKLQDDAAQNSKRLADKQQDSRLSINSRQFDRFLQGQSPEEQSRQLQIRFNKLIEAANKSLKSGNTELAEKFLEQADGIASRFDDITGSVLLENRFLREQQSIFAEINKLQSEQVANAKKAEEANAPILEQARQQIELAKDLLQRRDAALKEGTPQGKAQAAAINDQLKGVLTNISNLGAQFSLGKALVGDLQGPEVQNAIDALRRVIDGKPLELQLEADNQAFIARQQQFLDANPLFVRLKFDDSEINRTQELIDLNKAAERGRNVEQNFPQTLQRTRQAEDLQTKLFEQARQKLVDEGKSIFSSRGVADVLANGENSQVVQALRQFDKLKKARDEIINSPESISKDTGRLTADAAKALADNTDQLKQIAKQFDISEVLNAIIDNTKLLIQERQKLASEAAEIQAGKAAEGALRATPDQRDEFLNTQRDLNQAVAPQQPQPATIIPSEDAQKAIQDADQLKKAVQDIPKNAQVNIDASSANTAQVEVDDLGTAIDALKAKGGNVGIEVQVDPAAQANIVQLTTDLDGLGVTGESAGLNTTSALSGIGGTAEAQVPGVLALASALLELAAAQAAAAGGGGEFASRGAFIQGFARGGQARGSDTVPAMLSAGEVVVNPKASRKFFSQLMAMNAGANPQFFGNGGFAGDQFGDVQINIDNRGNGDKLDGRAIYREFKRQARRGTLGR